MSFHIPHTAHTFEKQQGMGTSFDPTSSFVRLFLINIDEMQPVPRITAIDGVPYRFVRKTKIVATYLE